MSRKILGYIVFFAVLLTGFLFFVFKDEDLSKSLLPVLNADVQDFSFTNQDGKIITQNNVENKVYVAEYFFTTCKGICPKMNANMRRVYDTYKDEDNFLILSHTCMPETDSVPVLKDYEARMISGELKKNQDGSYKIEYDSTNRSQINSNWNFVTGDKTALYKMARQSYMIDNNKPDTAQSMADQFIHTQFFALVDKQRRLRGIYDGLKEEEIEKLLKDIKGLLKEKVVAKRFLNGFSNNPN
ncbi:MAG TPA: SCO family protein [Ferruginibacter sp.]|nr:SCO family protein [Ferruginibacter sp.]